MHVYSCNCCVVVSNQTPDTNSLGVCVCVLQVAVAGGQVGVIHTADSVVGLVASLGIHPASLVARIGLTLTGAVCHRLGQSISLTLGVS